MSRENVILFIIVMSTFGLGILSVSRHFCSLREENRTLVKRAHVLFLENESLRFNNHRLSEEKENLLHYSWDLKEFYDKR